MTAHHAVAVALACWPVHIVAAIHGGELCDRVTRWAHRQKETRHG